MNSSIQRRQTCRMCDSSNLDLVFQLEPTPIGDAYITENLLAQVQESYPIDLFLCKDCGLSQLLDVIPPDVLYRDYIYETGSSLGLADHFRSYAKSVIAQIKPSGDSLVVDIGSNDGTLLRFFKEHGVRVLGVDPAREIAHDTTLSGIETLPEFFTPELAQKIREEHGGATIITANNVFANIDDLMTLSEGIRSLLVEDGIFVFESYYLADLMRNLVFDFIYHEHLSSFAVKPVQKFFERLGMQLFDVKQVPTKGGSLRYFAQLSGGNRPIEPAVASLVAAEEEMGLYQPEAFSRLSDTVQGLKKGMVDLLEKLRREGKTIAGFGASITGTTLIYHFGIGGYLDYLVDDNPAKQGRFSPGLHLPVYPADALYEKKPDYAVVLAWRFVDPIVQKNSEFIERGGHFIVPVPELKII